MKVAFVLANYPPHQGGVETHVEHLAAGLRQRGAGVVVYTCEPIGARAADGIEIVGMGRKLEVGDVLSFPSLSAVRGLSEDLRRRAVTHVSVHTRFFPATWLGLWAGRRVGVPTMLTEHGGGPVSSGSRTTSLAAALVDRTAGRLAFRAADDVMAVSAVSRDFVRTVSGRSATVCGNGIDLPFWRAGAEVEQRRRLLYVGRLVAEKGWRDFLTVVRETPDVPAFLVGGGPDLEAARQEVVRMGLSQRVTVTGPLTPRELRQYYGGAVYVNPSVAAEGFQTTLLEAAACGARIATYEVGGAAEVSSAGANAEIVPSGDVAALVEAVRRCLATPSSTALGLAAYDWGQIVAVYLRAFERLNRNS